MFWNTSRQGGPPQTQHDTYEQLPVVDAADPETREDVLVQVRVADSLNLFLCELVEGHEGHSDNTYSKMDEAMGGRLLNA